MSTATDALIVELSSQLMMPGLRRQYEEIARNARPWLVGSLVVMVVTGVPLFLSESIRCYYNPPFWWKMQFFAAALVFTFTVHRRVARADEDRVGPIWGKLVAVVSLALWFGVGFSGRWISFY